MKVEFDTDLNFIIDMMLLYLLSYN